MIYKKTSRADGDDNCFVIVARIALVAVKAVAYPVLRTAAAVQSCGLL